MKEHVRGSTLFTIAFVLGTLGACGGGDNKGRGSDTTTAASAPAVGAASGTIGDVSAAAGATTSSGTGAPITGKTVDVKMIGDEKGYRFEPANFTVKTGDGARFTNVSGGPHDVTFWPDSIPAGMATQLSANMPNTTAPLTGPLLTALNQTYIVSFAGLKPGVYHYYCTPHLALGMKGVITVQ